MRDIMLYVYPDYYKAFKCISRDCRHSCCIGWEIDIDEATALRYKNTEGELGERLRRSIAWESPPHFILGDGERCPFLNGDSLCDLICVGGDGMLCGICRDHPRFRCELPGRVEIGLGLCCEAAGALILGRKEPTVLEYSAPTECEDEIIALRDELIGILQNRVKSIEERASEMLRKCGGALPEKSLSQWADIFLGLERLDGAWENRLAALKTAECDFEAFRRHMSSRENEYEQLLVYFVYRHFANSPDLWEAAARGAFAVLGYKMIYAMGAAQYAASGEFTFSDQVELCRLFSSEIEYSEDNLYELFEILY